MSRDFGIQKENCQRAKTLSSPVQRQEKMKHINEIKKSQREKHKVLYAKESDKYNLNTICKNRVTETYLFMTTTLSKEEVYIKASRTSFLTMTRNLSKLHFGEHDHKGISKSKLTLTQQHAFIHLRHETNGCKGHYPIYINTSKKSREELMDMCFDSIGLPLQPRHFRLPLPDPTTQPEPVDI